MPRRRFEKFQGSLAAREEQVILQRNTELLRRLNAMEKTYSGLFSDQGESFATSKGGTEMASQIAALRARLGIKQSKSRKPVD